MAYTLHQLEVALVNADKAGDTDAARKLAAIIVRLRQDPANSIPDAQIRVQQEDPTLGEQIVGAGEAALTTGTALTGGTIGMVGGTLKGLAAQILSGKFGTPEAARMVEEEAMRGAQALTYEPRTQSGRDQAAAVGKVLQQVIPATPLTAELGALAAGTKAAAPAMGATAARVAAPIRAAGERAVTAVQDALPIPGRQPGVTPGTGASGGAAGVDMATLRQAKADELPVPIKLTEGQRTRQFEQQRFERETAKDPTLGDPIRQRFSEQNQQLQQNMDAFLDMTGAEAADLRSVGASVDAALRSRAARDKTKIRTLYKEAEKAGEMEAPVLLGNVVQHIVDNAPEAEVANVLKAVRAKALQLGVAVEDPSGGLLPQPVPLKTAELFRRSINNATNAEPTNIRQAAIMKGLIDEQTDGMGGKLYKRAREARVRYARDYEDASLVKNLLGQKKGSADRAIAMEDVLNRTILAPSTSLDMMRQVRKLLQTEGENGKQAWRELQGGTLRHIKDEALKNVAPDQAGNRVLSPSQLDRVIMNLDKSGKLDFIFGKKGAEQLRTINDVAKDVLTAPAGSVNTSNTASVVLAALDMAISGSAGLPAPVLSSVHLLTKSIKNAKTRARVKRALGE